MRETFFVVIFLVGQYGCQAPPIGSYPADRFEFFLLDVNGHSLINSVDDKIDIYYYIGNNVTVINSPCGSGDPECRYINSTGNGQPYAFYYSSRPIVNASAFNGVKEFYLKRNNDVDTIAFTLSNYDGCKGMMDALYNGEPAIGRKATPTTVLSQSFVFRKR
jgi:hypothetical protein